MKAFLPSKKGTSKVLGTLMAIIITFASGFFFLNFVMSNVDFAKNTFNTQMQGLLLDSFFANTTHIVAFIKNAASQTVELTLAYVNNALATLQKGKVLIAPLSTAAATIVGSFSKGSSYTVKLTNIFNIAIAFSVTV
jgi:hypothetical protein